MVIGKKRIDCKYSGCLTSNKPPPPQGRGIHMKVIINRSAASGGEFNP
jgi:hypothetical protein